MHFPTKQRTIQFLNTICATKDIVEKIIVAIRAHLGCFFRESKSRLLVESAYDGFRFHNFDQLRCQTRKGDDLVVSVWRHKSLAC